MIVRVKIRFSMRILQSNHLKQGTYFEVILMFKVSLFSVRLVISYKSVNCGLCFSMRYLCANYEGN